MSDEHLTEEQAEGIRTTLRTAEDALEADNSLAAYDAVIRALTALERGFEEDERGAR